MRGSSREERHGRRPSAPPSWKRFESVAALEVAFLALFHLDPYDGSTVAVDPEKRTQKAPCKFAGGRQRIRGKKNVPNSNGRLPCLKLPSFESPGETLSCLIERLAITSFSVFRASLPGRSTGPMKARPLTPVLDASLNCGCGGAVIGRMDSAGGTKKAVEVCRECMHPAAIIGEFGEHGEQAAGARPSRCACIEAFPRLWVTRCGVWVGLVSFGLV